MQNNFKSSITKLNPSLLKINNNVNAFHFAIACNSTASNILISDPDIENKLVLFQILEQRKFELTLLTKLNFSYDDLSFTPLKYINSNKLVFPFWHNDDAVSTMFIEDFYDYLKNNKSVYKAFKQAQKHIKQKYNLPLFSENFLLIQ